MDQALIAIRDNTEKLAIYLDWLETKSISENFKLTFAKSKELYIKLGGLQGFDELLLYSINNPEE